jgi:hypothetical protein
MRRRDLITLLGSPFFPVVGGTSSLRCLSIHASPQSFQWREYVVAGGLVNYGMSLAADYRQMGVYVGRVLYGENEPGLLSRSVGSCRRKIKREAGS